MADEDKHLGIDVAMLLPWSSREVFSADLCSLPGDVIGCRRTRAGLPLGIAPSYAVHMRDGSQSATHWLLFVVSSDGALTITTHADRSSWAPLVVDRHYAAFHCRVLEQPDKEQVVPEHAEYYAWAAGNEKHGGVHVPVVLWRQPDLASAETIRIRRLASSSPSPKIKIQAATSTQTLLECFGQHIFVDHTIAIEGDTYRLSLAGLIRQYVRSRCATFHQHPAGEHFGVTLCQLELATHSGVDRSIVQSATFSAIDPTSFQLRFLDEPALHGPSPSTVVRAALSECMVSLSVQTASSPASQDQITYADCFTRRHRAQILASEVDNLFLAFPLGEIVAYLLHWILLRICALDLPRNREFLGSLSVGSQLLIDTPVQLFSDLSIYLPSAEAYVAAHPQGRMELAVYDEPTPFSRVLKSLALSPDSPPDALTSTLEFLLQHFSGAPTNEALANLPMYRGIRWRAEDPNPSASSSQYADRIARLLRTLFSAIDPECLRDAERARESLDSHVRRCVFPIQHILTHWPCDASVTHYVILPLWEAEIAGEVRPTIMAHAFCSLGQDGGRAGLRRRIASLQRDLVPYGLLVAHSAYREQQRNANVAAEAERAARNIAQTTYNIGHPLKDRIGPILCDINTLREAIEDGRQAGDITASASLALEKHLDSAEAGVIRLENLGHLMNVISQTLRDRSCREGVYANPLKPSLASVQPYSLASALRKLAARLGQYEGARLLLAQEQIDLLQEQIIPWIPTEKGLVRPFDTLYDEILSEALLNALRYGHRTNGLVMPDISIQQIRPRSGSGLVRCLVLRNRCGQAPRTAESLSLRSDEWCEWDFQSSRAPQGGLFFLATCVGLSGVGTVYARLSDSTSVFSLGLQLQGLCLGGSGDAREEHCS